MGGDAVLLCSEGTDLLSPLPKSLIHRLHEILEIGEDMEIDIPHIWLYLAEIITPILREGGIPMEELFR